jgi:uncharacterized protein (TIGR02391 family)
MATRKGQRAPIPPTLSPAQAIPLLQRQYERADAVAKAHFNDSGNEVWLNSTENILQQTFGQPNGEWHPNTRAFMYADSGVSQHFNMSDAEVQQDHGLKTQKRKALLKGFIEQLEDLAPPSARTAPDQYRFHSEIERVSGELYRNGHYKSAALEAYIRVIDQVRLISRIADDGDSLMNKAFACDKQTPVLQFNTLATESERDEQRGIFFLFKGMVGLRNSKAHSNRLFDDPLRAHEYLALASLLMRLLEIAQVSPTGGPS